MSPPSWIRRAQSRLSAPVLRKVAWRASWVLGGIAFLYLAAANVLLQTRLLRDVASEGPDLELDYESAYSIWPGRAHFTGLALTAQDHNVQFAIHVESGVVDVSLHELFAKRFRALMVRVNGTSFRMRHKVQSVGENAERLAAYPPIDGYPDPPLYTGAKPGPIKDEEYNLWEIALADVDAELSEIWILEHRYQGAARARGGFHLRPARWFEVDPATLALGGGTLVIGASTLVPRLNADMAARIERVDATKESGLGMLKSISAKLSIAAAEVDLSVANIYLPADVRALGWLGVTAATGMTAGVLDAGSTLDLSACPLHLTASNLELEGSVNAGWRVVEAGKVEANVSSPALELRGAIGHKPAALIQPSVAATFSIGDVTQPFALDRVEAALPEVVVPSLGIVNDVLARAGSRVELGGRLDAEARAVWQPRVALSGRARARLVGGVVQAGSLGATLAGKLDVSLDDAAAGATRGVTRGAVAIELDHVELKDGKRTLPPLAAALRTNALTLSLVPEPKVSATWQLSAEPADALLSLLIGAPVLEDLAATLLDLERLDAKTRVVASPRLVRVELARGESGALAGRGFWQRPARGRASGAFLLTTTIANLGLAVDGSEVKTDMFVSDDWLEQRQPQAALSGGP